jgi:glycosyltransferase involved in cell wall biosynthesis
MINTICLDENTSTTRLLKTEKTEIVNNPKDKFESVLFLPKDENRKGEGGLRTKGYFKKSYEDKPLISIVTIVYNGEAFLEETIKSVINQSYDNVEYIIIDGGSSDGTVDIIKKYEDKVSYWISEKDKGIYDAMNKGIEAATGDYINFLNAGDDFCDQYVLEKIFLQHKYISYDIVYGSAIVVDKNRTNKLLLKPKAFTKFNLLFWTTRTVCHQSIFVNKNILEPYSLNYKLKGELNWYFDLLKKSKKFLVIDIPVVYYSLGGTGDINYKLNTMETLKVVFKQMNIFGITAIPVILYKYLRKVFKND